MDKIKEAKKQVQFGSEALIVIKVTSRGGGNNSVRKLFCCIDGIRLRHLAGEIAESTFTGYKALENLRWVALIGQL